MLHLWVFCPTQACTIPLVTRKILQLISWWIFYVRVLYEKCRQGTWISEPAFVEWTWDQVTTDWCCLLQQLAFSESCHFSWDTFPANTMAYEKGRAPACCHHSWRSRHCKSMQWIWTGARCFCVLCTPPHNVLCDKYLGVCAINQYMGNPWHTWYCCKALNKTKTPVSPYPS
jgi:hypothetical protein